MKILSIVEVLSFFLLIACNSKCNKTQNLHAENPAKATQNLIDSSLFVDQDSLLKAVAQNCSINFITNGNYSAAKAAIESKRLTFLRDIQANPVNEVEIIQNASEYLTKAIVNQIIPFWYGTKWDFNGYTSTPQNDAIACGYFAFTVLNHARFNLNRYDFAKMYSLDAIESLSEKSPLNYNCLEATCFLDSLKINQEEGLYLVGLSCHIGFLYYTNGRFFFIHSDYINSSGVKIELAENSPAFSNGSVYYAVNLSKNEKIIQKWIKRDTITIK